MLPRQHFLACTTVKMQVRTETWELRYVITSTPPLFSDLLSEEPSNTLYSSFANGLVHRLHHFPWKTNPHKCYSQTKEEFIIGYRPLPEIVTHHTLISVCWSVQFECFCNSHSTSFVIHAGMKHCKQFLFFVPLKSFQTVVFFIATILNMRQINTALENLHHTEKGSLDPIVSVY